VKSASALVAPDLGGMSVPKRKYLVQKWRRLKEDPGKSEAVHL
jgi:hypothetical protein